MEFILTLGIAAGLAFIPANIAKKKGESFGLWWLYGWMLFIVALIHSLLLPDPEAQAAQAVHNTASSADALVKYKELLDSGVITQEEFEEKKKQLLEK